MTTLPGPPVPLTLHDEPVVRSLQPENVHETMPDIALTYCVLAGIVSVTTTLLAVFALRFRAKIL